jgi:hypothetical protein
MVAQRESILDLTLRRIESMLLRCMRFGAHRLSLSQVSAAGRPNITQADPQLPDWSLQVVRPRAAQFGPIFVVGGHAAYLVDPLE